MNTFQVGYIQLLSVTIPVVHWKISHKLIQHFFFQKCFINVLNNNIFEALFDHQSHIFYIIKQRISIHHHHIRGRAIKRVLCPFSNFLIFGEYLLHLNVLDNQTDFIIIQVIQKYPK